MVYYLLERREVTEGKAFYVHLSSDDIIWHILHNILEPYTNWKGYFRGWSVAKLKLKCSSTTETTNVTASGSTYRFQTWRRPLKEFVPIFAIMLSAWVPNGYGDNSLRYLLLLYRSHARFVDFQNNFFFSNFRNEVAKLIFSVMINLSMLTCIEYIWGIKLRRLNNCLL